MKSFRSFYLPVLFSHSVLASINEATFAPSDTITKDVAIIGGGASGTYAGVRFHSDFNKSIVIIETQNRLGGHVNTYKIPGTNTTIEYGVQSYINYGPAPSFFKKLGVETVTWAAQRLTTVNVDIKDGTRMDGYISPSLNATNDALKIWLAFVEKHDKLIQPGYWNFPDPGAIPEEMLMPFGVFARKYGITAAVPRITAISDVGVGGIKEVLTLEVMQAFGSEITKGVLAGDLLAPVGSNSLLYQRAYALLGNDVLLGSRLKETDRSADGVRMIVSTPAGDKLVKAKQVLWTPYPSQDKNLKTFDEDEKEEEVFRDWVPLRSFVAVIEAPCLPENYSVQYLAPAAMGGDYVAIRDYNYTLRFDSTGPSGLQLFRVLFSTSYAVTHNEARATIAQNVQNLITADTFNYTGACNVTFKAFADHSGVSLPKERERINDGLFQKMNALQGWRNTWWTGRSWTGYYSSNVWAFTDTVLEKMVKAMEG